MNLAQAGTPEIDATDDVRMVIPPDELDKQRDLTLRKGYLQIIDAIERRWGISPTTAELRRGARGVAKPSQI
ncbi:MAG: hypothetical protein KIT08_01375 [Anaerolineales bacterium]|nr:MAG: hypothetical protein KIT08_01375 [Anaerolineales bacterium]